MLSVRRLIALTAAGAAIATAAPAGAAIVLVGQFAGNDCGGQGGLPNCYAYYNPGTGVGGTQQGYIDLGSPVIVKFNNEDEGLETEVSGHFSSIDGSEFNLGYFESTNTLQFDYNPGVDDPEVHYFTVKQSNGFALFYSPDPITSWSQDLDLLGGYFTKPGWSHITFFDTKGTPAVPEPSTWALMLLGFGAMGWVMRRRKSAEPRMRVLYN